MRKIFYIVLLLVSTIVFGQNKGITYQAVIYLPSGQNIPGANITNVPMTNKSICLKFSFFDASDNLEYEEVVKTTTDEFGMVNISIGSGKQTAGYASDFSQIVWRSADEKSLKVGLDSSGLCNQFDLLSSDVLASVPFANAAITAENVSGVIALANGGTGATTATAARVNLGLGNVDNSSDANKPISNATQTALNTKENASNKSTSTLLGDSDFLYPTQNAVKIYVDSKISSSTIADADASTKGKLKLAGDLSGSADVPTVPGLVLKEDTVNKSTLTTLGTSDVLFPTQKAVKTYVDTSIAVATIVDADASTKGKLKLAGDLSGTADVPTVPGLALKEDTANKSTLTTLGTSDVLFPTQKAVKTYVDASIAVATIVDADASTKGKLKLAGDLSGTADVPTVPGLALKEDTANKSTLTTLGTSDVLFPTQKAVKTYVDGNIITVTNAINAEATTARAAEATLTTNLATEVTTARAAESANASAIAAEATTARAAEATLTTNLATEATTARAAEATLTTNLATEATTARAAEATLTTDLAAANAAIALKENVANKSTNIRTDSASDEKYPSVKAIKDYVDELNAAAGVADGSITSIKIANGTIAVADLADNAVETAKIKNSNITTIKLADDAVETTKIKDANVTNAKLDKINIPLSGFGAATADVALGTKKLTDVADPTDAQDAATKSYVDTATGVITTLADGKIYLGNTTNVATEVTLSGDVTIDNAGVTSIETGKVTSAKILDGTIVVADLANDAVETAKIKDANVTTTKLADDAVETAKIKNANVTEDKLAVDAVTSAKILDGTIAVADLADNAVETAKIKNSNITTIKLADDAVETTKIKDANVTNAKLDKINIPLSGFGAATADVALGTKKLTDVADPTDAQDAATKSYVDTATGVITTLADGKIYLGNATNVATEVTLSGDVTIDNAGVTSIETGKVTSAKILDGTIVVADLANDAVETAKIKNANVTNEKLASDAVTSAKIKDGEIVDADIATSAAIADTKLATIATSGKVSNSATTATDANTASAIVARDANGDFAAGTITADLNGNAATVTNGVYTTNKISALSATTSAELKGVISDETGSGALVFATSPTLVTPTLGVANATSVNKVTITEPTNSATLTIADGKTLTASDDATVSGTNTGDQTITLTGDVTGTGTGSFATTIGAAKVTNAMLAGSIDLTTKVTGILPEANGGTGSATKNFVDLTNDQTVAGNKNFSSDITVNTIKFGTGSFSDISNVAIGKNTLQNNASGTSNIAIGRDASHQNASGSRNIIIGDGANYYNSSSNDIIAIGHHALHAETGEGNVAIGTESGARGNVSNTLTNSTFLGKNTNAGGATINNATAIGYGATVNASNTIQLGNTSVTDVNTSGAITSAAGITGTQLTATVATGTAPFVVTSTTPVANLSIGGNAATVTTNANLTGDVTSTGNATTVVNINGTSLAGLATGILKNTTTTGVPSIAVAADFPTLNQNTTGTAANVTGTVAIANGGTGSATKNFVDLTNDQTVAGVKTFSGSSTVVNQNLTVNAAGTSGQGIILSDDGDIVDNNDGAATFRFGGGIKINDGNKTAGTTTKITLANNGNITSAGSIESVGFKLTGGTPAAGKVLTSDANGLGAWLTIPATNLASGVTGILPGANGGTGIDNTGKTITLGGNLTTLGAFATTLTSTATTTVTLPTTGTLATLAGTETLTNKTLTSPTLTTPVLGLATATSINKVAFTAPATGATLTIADGKTLTATNSIAFAGTDATTMTFPTTNATIARTDAAQTFTGAQTFSSTIMGSINGNAATATKLATAIKINTVDFDGSADITVTAAAGTLTGSTLASNVVSSSLTSVGTIATGTWNGTTIAIANGGTGQTTKAAAFDALSPMTTSGDIIYGGTSGTGTRLAKGTDGQVLVLASGVPKWSNNSGGGVLSKTDSYDILTTDSANLVVFSGSTASKTIKLPSAVDVGAGREITIKNIASVSVSITASAGKLISDSTTTNATSLSIGIEPSNNWIKAISDGTNWIILRALF